MRLEPGLHLVATPIGNLGDLSQRAAETLRAADLVLCEDKRVTSKLSKHLGFSIALQVYNDQSGPAQREALLARMAAGEALALVSDAGTPLVSDPGFKLVRAALDANLKVTGVPGPVAAVHALSLSGLPSQAFAFVGFLPPKSAARRRALASYSGFPGTLICYEGPSRLAALLADSVAVLGGGREAAVARELTKLYEEVRRGTLANLADFYAAQGQPKGELVVLMGPAPESKPDPAQLDAVLRQALEESSLKDAVSEVADAYALPRREVYARALKLK